MRLTTRTNLAMRVLMICAVNPQRTLRKRDIAERCNASENHLAQVIHLLGQEGFVQTLRGRGGGLRLAHPPSEIVVGTVFRTFEGGRPFVECFPTGENTCPLAGVCKLGCLMSEALEAFYARLDRVSLADLTEGNTGLEALLRLPRIAA
ncbi:MAG: Rrf2 family transcriptional regulator [Gemmobacter sp.]